MAQPRRNSTRGNVQPGRLVRPVLLGKPDKYTVLAHMWQFCDYVEDFLATPKELRKNLDMSVLRNKVKQCKEVLVAAEGK